MEIKGPLSIGIGGDPNALSRELHVGFKPAFRALDPADRHRELTAYLDDLRALLAGLEPDSADAQGVALILQVAEQVLPFIEGDEIALEEDIVVEVRPEFSLAGLAPGPAGLQ